MRKLVVVAAFGGAICMGATGLPSWAGPSRCFANGDVVSFDGVASPGTPPSQWVLNLSRPICVTRDLSLPGTEIVTIRIIGTPPPLGVPLELTGKLLLGPTAAESRMFVALVVRSGRKVSASSGVATAPQTTPVPRSEPSPKIIGRCDTPPYGGTQADYQDFVRRFGTIVRPQKILAAICNAKFGKAPRDGLHKLGLSDTKIDSESTEQLAAATITALKNLVNTIE